MQNIHRIVAVILLFYLYRIAKQDYRITTLGWSGDVSREKLEENIAGNNCHFAPNATLKGGGVQRSDKFYLGLNELRESNIVKLPTQSKTGS